MRQGILWFIIVFSAASMVAFHMTSVYAERDVKSLSKFKLSETLAESRDQVAIRIERYASFSNMRYNFGLFGWMTAIAALFYTLRLAGKYEVIENRNETLRADLREIKIAERSRQTGR